MLKDAKFDDFCPNDCLFIEARLRIISLKNSVICQPVTKNGQLLPVLGENNFLFMQPIWTKVAHFKKSFMKKVWNFADFLQSSYIFIQPVTKKSLSSKYSIFQQPIVKK